MHIHIQIHLHIHVHIHIHIIHMYKHTRAAYCFLEDTTRIIHGFGLKARSTDNPKLYFARLLYIGGIIPGGPMPGGGMVYMAGTPGQRLSCCKTLQA